MSKIRTKLAEFLKQKRKENNINQLELSQKAGVGLQFVRDLEQGKTTLRIDKVNDVLALFGYEMYPVKSEFKDED